MKVIDLHIKNIRGVRDIDLKPEGNNFVIFGANGTGKSAVVDALDFLFTGDISRLKFPNIRVKLLILKRRRLREKP